VDAAAPHRLHPLQIQTLLGQPTGHHLLLHGGTGLTPASEALSACRDVEPL